MSAPRTLLERHQRGIRTRHRPRGGATLSSLGLRIPSSGPLVWTNATLLNAWVAFNAATYHTAGYTKTPDGLVQLRGLIKDGTASAGTTLFTLPVGYRPSKILTFAIQAGAAIEVIDIQPDGDVVLATASSSTDLTLSNIIFDPS